MSNRFGQYAYIDLPLTATETQRVLRNTYWLLALSMIPTVLGAWIGIATGITYALSSSLGTFLFLIGGIGGVYAIEKSKDSIAGVYVLLGFTFYMGLMLSRIIAMVLGFQNGAELVMIAFGGTAGVFFLMAALSSVIKQDLSGMGKWLMVGAIVLMFGSLINLFVASTAGVLVLSVLSIGIFSIFMLFDLNQIIEGGETNYVSATLRIYLDIINVFQSLLELLGILDGESD